MGRTGIFRSRSSSFFLFIAAALAASSGCSPEKPDGLRVGINAWPAYEFLYLAQEKGFYRDEGVEVRILEFSSLSDAQRAYERGQINALASTAIDILETRDHSSRSPQIVQVMDASKGADVILARPGITSLSGLRGARVGVEVESLGGYVLARALEKAGLNPADITMVHMEQPDMEEALRKGNVDAVISYSPYSTKLVRDIKANVIFSSADIPGEVIDVLAVEAETTRKQPQDVIKLLRAYHRAIAYAQQHPAEAYRIMAEREGLTPEEFKVALTNGIELLFESDQKAYFQPGGKLAVTIDHANRILRQKGQLNGPDRREGIYTAAFIGKEGGE